MSANILRIKDLNIFFDRARTRQGLYNVSMDIPAGKVTAIIGASGSGKSITSLAIMGLLPPNVITEGEIVFDNEHNLLALSDYIYRGIRGKDISMVFQEPMSALNPLMSCGQQLIEVVRAHKDIKYPQAYDMVIQWLEKVQLPNPTLTFHKYPHELSGGQKQRIMIAMAMINAPKLLIADEPTTALDVLVQQEIIELLKHLQQESGTAIIFITHDLALAQKIADHIIEMKDGRVVDRTLQIDAISPKSAYNIDIRKPILEVEDVSISYGKSGSAEYFRAVQSVNFQLFPKETLGIVGGSGCGKTTLSKAILGLLPIESGHIYYQGKDIAAISSSEWKKLRKSIQIIYQDPYASLNPRIRIGEAIAEPLRVHEGASSAAAKEAVYAILKAVGLNATDYDKYPHQFSGGQRQRICIARALILKPDIVICDESVAALDITIRTQILDLLLSLQEQYNVSYIFITHDMQVVNKICDRVIVMKDGAIVEMNITKDIMQQPVHPYTSALIAASPL